MTIRYQKTTLIITPNVVSTARQYYNCVSLQGMELENEGGYGSAGSHWESRILKDDV